MSPKASQAVMHYAKWDACGWDAYGYCEAFNENAWNTHTPKILFSPPSMLAWRAVCFANVTLFFLLFFSCCGIFMTAFTSFCLHLSAHSKETVSVTPPWKTL